MCYQNLYATAETTPTYNCWPVSVSPSAAAPPIGPPSRRGSAPAFVLYNTKKHSTVSVRLGHMVLYYRDEEVIVSISALNHLSNCYQEAD